MEQTKEKNYLMTRALDSSAAAFNLLFNSHVVAVGWSKVRFVDYTKDQTEELIKAVRQEYYNSPSERNQVISKKLNYVRRFHNIKTGDFIIVPFYDSIRLAIAKDENIYSVDNQNQDYSNQRKVEYLFNSDGGFKTIRRDDLSEALQRRLRVRGSIVSDLYEFKDEIENLFSRENYSWTSDLEEKEILMRQKLKRTLKENICTGKNNLKTGGIGLENLVKELLEIEGYTAKVLSKQKKLINDESDADVYADKSDRFQETKIIAQIKHHSGYSDDWGLQQLKNFKANESFEDHKLVFITSAQINDSVVKTAEIIGIETIDGDDLCEWIVQALSKLSITTKRKLGLSIIPQFVDF